MRAYAPKDGRYNVWAGNPSGNPRDEVRCHQQVHEAGRAGLSYQCRHKWIVEREGHRWCRQHDPKAIDAKNAALEQKYKAKNAADEFKWELIRAESDVIKAAMDWFLDGSTERLLATCMRLAEMEKPR